LSFTVSELLDIDALAVELVNVKVLVVEVLNIDALAVELPVVETFSTARKIFVRLTRDPAVAFGFGLRLRMRQAI
jgi:hypothetical protein